MNAEIEAKEKEIEEYKLLLVRYRESSSGRWLDLGCRRLAELKDELAVLKIKNSSG